jgi:hypothetical protein
MLAIAVVLAAASGGCGTEELQSAPLDREIAVDGDAGDWEGMLRFVEDAEMSYGLANDERCLYIALVVGDREVRRQVIMSGLYLWFDPEGKENRRFGIRFPIGLQENAEDMAPLFRERDPNKLSDSFDETVKEMMVIGPNDQTWRRAAVNSVDGIETAARADRNALVLEFKVPVAGDGEYDYGVGALPGEVIGIGVETPKINLEDMKAKMGSAGGGPGGMGGGMGGGMSGDRPPGGQPPGGRRPEGGERPGMPDPIKVWTKVRLAESGYSS